VTSNLTVFSSFPQYFLVIQKFPRFLDLDWF
jgi:hypothetical protein